MAIYNYSYGGDGPCGHGTYFTFVVTRDNITIADGTMQRPCDQTAISLLVSSYPYGLADTAYANGVLIYKPSTTPPPPDTPPPTTSSTSLLLIGGALAGLLLLKKKKK